MPSKFRQASRKRISFFSFQDIITSVTGILILVTLMMTLYLNRAGGASPPTADDRSGTDLKTRIESLSQSNLWMIAQLNQLASAPSTARLTEEKRELESSLRRAESSEMAQVRALRAQQDGLVKTNSQMAATSEQLKVKLEDLQKELSQKRSQTNAFFAIRGLPNSPKTPVIGIVSRDSIEIELLGDATGGRQVGGVNSASDFRRLLASYDARSNFVVFVVRPSGIARFEACREVATQAGFEVGYEPIAEDLQVKFQYEEGP